MDTKKLYAFALNPWVIIGSLVASAYVAVLVRDRRGLGRKCGRRDHCVGRLRALGGGPRAAAAAAGRAGCAGDRDGCGCGWGLGQRVGPRGRGAVPVALLCAVDVPGCVWGQCRPPRLRLRLRVDRTVLFLHRPRPRACAERERVRGLNDGQRGLWRRHHHF